MIGPAPPGVGKLSSTVELRIQARNLKKMDALSESDPCCILYLQRAGQWIEVERTECQKNQPNPNFIKPITLEYFFEEIQNLQLVMYDLDNSTASLADDGKFFFFFFITFHKKIIKKILFKKI